jgi:Family of unknown function (DUF6338)
LGGSLSFNGFPDMSDRQSMEFTLEGFLIVVLGILPGFVVSVFRTILLPRTEQIQVKTEQWIAINVLGSLVLNILAGVAILKFRGGGLVDFNTHLADISGKIKTQTLVEFASYFIALYSLALLFGAGSCIITITLSFFRVRPLRLTPISPLNVFTDALAGSFRTRTNLRLRGRPEQLVPWLRLERAETVVAGRLQKSSVRFEVDEPVEVFLSPAFIFRGGAIDRVEPPSGVYLRLLTDDVVAVLSGRADWEPEEL